MHTFLDNFQQSGKYSSQLASHQAELGREEKYPDQKCLNISSLQTDYVNLENSLSGSSRHSDKEILPRQSAHIVDFLTILWKNVSKKSEKKKRKLVLLVLHLTKIWIVQLGNTLDADLKLILSQNVPSHLNKVRKDASLKI